MAFNDYRDIIRQMEREMQQLSDEAFRGFFAFPSGGAGRFWQPPVDIHETNEAVVIKIELAGVKADDLQVSLTPDDRYSQRQRRPGRGPRRPRGAGPVPSARDLLRAVRAGHRTAGRPETQPRGGPGNLS